MDGSVSQYCINSRPSSQLTALSGSLPGRGESHPAYVQLTSGRCGELPCRWLDLLYVAPFSPRSANCRHLGTWHPPVFPPLAEANALLEALLPCDGLGIAPRQKAGVNKEPAVVQCLETFVAHILPSLIPVYSRRVRLMPSVSIMARSRSTLSTLANDCLPFVMLFLRTPQFHQSPSRSPGPHSDAASSVSSPSIP